MYHPQQEHSLTSLSISTYTPPSNVLDTKLTKVPVWQGASLTTRIAFARVWLIHSHTYTPLHVCTGIHITDLSQNLNRIKTWFCYIFIVLRSALNDHDKEQYVQLLLVINTTISGRILGTNKSLKWGTTLLSSEDHFYTIPLFFFNWYATDNKNNEHFLSLQLISSIILYRLRNGMFSGKS